MKKVLAIAVAAIILAAAAVPASAGDHGWATAGKVLTGIIGLNILGHALAAPYYYPYSPYYPSYPAPAYAYPPGGYYPDGPVWVPGHYEVRLRRQWVSGHWADGRFGPQRGGDEYDYDDDGDYRYESGRVWISGHYRDVEVRVWIPGHWEG